MKMNIKMPRGTKDVLPKDAYKWRHVEKTARDTARSFAIGEIRFPTFESTDLFVRGVGDTTDVVQKEMYTFLDKDSRSMTLRPEGTASTVRSFLESGLYGANMPQKLYYIVPCFRYEKPQAGRLREFHQFGIEYFGSEGPESDVEVISVAHVFFSRLGLKNIKLNINSIGCKECRKDYHAALKEYFKGHVSDLCPTCKERLHKNPMRILDCKNDSCRELSKGAPKVIDFLCAGCEEHFSALKSGLTSIGIDFSVDPAIVRGLDYYTRTVFEFISDEIGAQGTVCGGGRYDGLVEELGGSPTPGLGFAIGLERIIMLMEAQRCEFKRDDEIDIYVASAQGGTAQAAQKLAYELRLLGLSAECDVMGRSLKAQMKGADRSGAHFVVVVGEEELIKGEALLKSMSGGEAKSVSLGPKSIFKEIKNSI